MSTVEIIPVGSNVLIDGEIPAIIQAVEIRGKSHSLMYQCVWWDERTRKSEWVNPEEISEGKKRRLPHLAGI